MMNHCKHKITPTMMQIFTLQPAFICELCNEYVEPISKWRIVRALINTLSLLTALYAAFSKLQGTLNALALMLAIIAAAVAVFFLGNYLILTKTPLQAARPQVNPDLMASYYDEEADLIDEDESQVHDETKWNRRM